MYIVYILLLYCFFTATPTTEIYTLSLQRRSSDLGLGPGVQGRRAGSHQELHQHQDVLAAVATVVAATAAGTRSEEHTSELQSRVDLVCRLLLEKKKKKTI